jgi:hypothetical protein
LDVIDVQHEVIDPICADHRLSPPIGCRAENSKLLRRIPASGDDTPLDMGPHPPPAARPIGGSSAPTCPLPLGSIRNPDQSRCREPVTVKVGGGGSQMKLPDYPDALPCEQPRRDDLK